MPSIYALGFDALVSRDGRQAHDSHSRLDPMMQMCNIGFKKASQGQVLLATIAKTANILRSSQAKVRSMASKRDDVKPQVSDARVYLKPNLIKGPVLTNVTALKTVSGTVPATCWVARAAFGENDLRWMIFREWLLLDAPSWFRNLYIRYGEVVGSWLENHAKIQGVVRMLMMPAVNRTLRK